MGLKPERRVTVTVAGRRGDYHVWTLATWCYELKEFLEEDLGVKLAVEVMEEDSELPRLYIDNTLVFEGLPGEEGYLIEIIKHYVSAMREKWEV